MYNEEYNKCFYESIMYCKKDILNSFNKTIEYYENEDESNDTNEMKERKLEVCYRFKRALEKCKLPELKDLWFYDYNFNGDSINLELCLLDSIHDTSYSVENVLLSIKCNYLTVDEYAKIQNVSPITVRQWIRRGKLRHAKKNGRDWIIPSLEKKPNRGYTPVTYEWEEALPESILEEFPFLRSFNTIDISQDFNKEYVCYLKNYKTKTDLTFKMSRSEIEALELALISYGKTMIEEPIAWFMPTIR